ncbi:3-oxoacyl-[acyl-carrier-protein] synthase III C-terminal domain-containing protein [Yoonia sp. BS5-3]|uniref:3-oxoacyl-ACP synthase III family protein n=1 Tax=Yoonia phaeophyticola TaxID=3137369 RepID=A0ABZ2V0G3_9RHOB
MKIAGIGSYLPRQILSAEALDQRHDLPPGSVFRATGVQTRHYCASDEDQISMGAAAAMAALDDADVQVSDIDLVIAAQAVPYQPIPATAPAYMRALEMPPGQAFGLDLNSTCLSFLSAMEHAAALLQQGRYRRALIVTSEVASRALPWPDKPQVAGLFGDGAAAMVLTDGGVLPVMRFATYPAHYDACGIGAGGTRFDFHTAPADFAAHAMFDMEGKTLFRLTATHFVPFVDALLDDAGWHRDEIDLIIPHQASPAGLSHIVRQCGFDPAKVIDISRDKGNQIAASIPIALAQVWPGLKPGAKLLFLGTSAGVSFGGAAVTL